MQVFQDMCYSNMFKRPFSRTMAFESIANTLQCDWPSVGSGFILGRSTSFSIETQEPGFWTNIGVNKWSVIR